MNLSTKIMEIKRTHLHLLQNIEHFQFIGHVVTFCEEANIKKIEPLLGPLKTALHQESLAISRPRKEEGMSELRMLDRQRDKAYRALQLLIKMHAYATDDDTRKAARQMRDVMDRYPKTNLANYDKESGMMKNLVADLRDEAMAPTVEKLGAADYISRLATANERFDARYFARLRTLTPQTETDVKTLRAATDKALAALLRRIDALDELEPETPRLPELIGQYNSLVENRRMMLARRAGTSKMARQKRAAEYAELLKPLLPALEQQMQLDEGALSFAGKTEGRSSKRHYLLQVGGQPEPDGKPRTIWVGINKKGELYRYEKGSNAMKPEMPVPMAETAADSD